MYAPVRKPPRPPSLPGSDRRWSAAWQLPSSCGRRRFPPFSLPRSWWRDKLSCHGNVIVIRRSIRSMRERMAAESGRATRGRSRCQPHSLAPLARDRAPQRGGSRSGRVRENLSRTLCRDGDSVSTPRMSASIQGVVSRPTSRRRAWALSGGTAGVISAAPARLMSSRRARTVCCFCPSAHDSRAGVDACRRGFVRWASPTARKDGTEKLEELIQGFFDHVDSSLSFTGHPGPVIRLTPWT